MDSGSDGDEIRFEAHAENIETVRVARKLGLVPQKYEPPAKRQKTMDRPCWNDRTQRFGGNARDNSPEFDRPAPDGGAPPPGAPNDRGACGGAMRYDRQQTSRHGDFASGSASSHTTSPPVPQCVIDIDPPTASLNKRPTYRDIVANERPLSRKSKPADDRRKVSIHSVGSCSC